MNSKQLENIGDEVVAQLARRKSSKILVILRSRVRAPLATLQLLQFFFFKKTNN